MIMCNGGVNEGVRVILKRSSEGENKKWWGRYVWRGREK